MTTRVKLLLLAGFLAVDAVLAVVVLRHVQQDPPESDLRGPAATAAPSATVRPDGQEKFDFNRPSSFSLSVSDDGAVMRALRGRCDGAKAAELVISTDDGRTTSTAETGLQEIVAVSATSKSELRLVGATGDCTVRKLRSVDGGTTWQADPASTLWFPDLAEESMVVSPAGRSDVGCTVTSLSEIDRTFARATCSDGTVRGTGNSGRKWVDLGRLDNVRVASFVSFNTGHALAVFRGCAAQEMTTRDGGRTWKPGGCITGERAQAIAASDSGLMAVVDDELYRSDDAGSSWSQAE